MLKYSPSYLTPPPPIMLEEIYGIFILLWEIYGIFLESLREIYGFLENPVERAETLYCKLRGY